MSVGLESGLAPQYTDGNVTDQPWRSEWTEQSFSPERMKQLIAEVTPSDEVRQGRKFGVHVFDGSDPHSDIGRCVEHTVFMKFFRNDLDVMREAYGPYDEHSTLLTVVDYEAQEPVGVVRVIEPSDLDVITLAEIQNPKYPWSAGLNMTDRWHEVGDDPAHTLDITTMAVMPNYQTAHSKNGASASLYSTCVRWSLAHGYNYWVSIVDKRIHTSMQAWGEPFEDFEGADWAPYMGSKASKPVHLKLDSALEKVRAFDEGIHALYTQSAGLEHQFVLPRM